MRMKARWFMVVGAAVLWSLTALLNGVVAGNLPLQAPHLANRAFTADATGNVRLNVIFKSAPAGREMALLGATRGRVQKMFHLIPASTLEVPAADLEATLAILEADPSVLLVEPDAADLRISVQDTPWGVVAVQAPQVLADGDSGAGVKVAVIDTGIDYTHPDLAANYAGGYDFVNNDSLPFDDNGHGTHVSGTIAAINNTIGVIGVAPGAALYGVKVLDSQGRGSFSAFAQGLQWAVDNGIKLVNFSAGSSVDSFTMHLACDAAYQAGVSIIAAAGNDGTGSVSFPAAYDSVLSVGAIDFFNQRATFSNYGAALDVVAPGIGVISTYPGGYAIGDGTSMAAPHVTGVAALIIKGGVTAPAKIYSRLKSYALDLGAPGRDDFYGNGLVQAVETVYHREFLTSPDGGEILASGSTFDIAWNARGGTFRYQLEFSLKGGRSWTLIDPAVPDSPFPWTVPSPGQNKKNCLVRISAFGVGGDLLAIDESNAPFTIEVVRLDAPNGGQVWTSGETHTVSWTVNQTARDVDSVLLQFSQDHGATWEDLVTLPGDATTYDWAVTAVARKRRYCLVRVVLKDIDGKGLGKDSSNAVFTVLPAPVL